MHDPRWPVRRDAPRTHGASHAQPQTARPDARLLLTTTPLPSTLQADPFVLERMKSEKIAEAATKNIVD